MSSSAFSVAFFIATIRLDSSLALPRGRPGRGGSRRSAAASCSRTAAGVRLEDELVAGDALGVLGRLDRQERSSSRALDERRHEAAVDDVDPAYVPARKSSVTSRASGRTSANVGRSPKPAKWASIGTPRAAHRVAALAADRDDREVARVLDDLAGDEADDVRVERARQAAVGRDQHDQPLAALALGEERVVLAAEHGREVGEDLVDLLAVRPRRERRVLGALQLRRRHELHRAGDLLDVLDATPMRRRISRWLAIECSGRCRRRADRQARNDWRKASMASSRLGGQLVGERLRLAELLEDVRALGLEEAVELASRTRLTRGVGTSSSLPVVAAYRIATCFSTGSGWYCGCLMISDSFSPRVSWSRVALSRSDANWANAASDAVLGEVQLERRRRPSSSPWSAPPSRRARPRCRCSARAAGRR